MLKIYQTTRLKYLNSTSLLHRLFATYPHYRTTAGARIGGKHDNKERMQYEQAVYEKIREPIRKKSLRTKPFHKYTNRPFISKYSIIKEPIELDNIPAHRRSVWLPLMLNDSRPTTLELDAIIQYHYRPPLPNLEKESFKAKFKKFYVRLLNPILGIITRSKLYFRNQPILSAEKAKQYFQQLTVGISEKDEKQWEEITSLNLFPIISKIYHDSNSTTHWIILSHDFQPKLFSLRHLKIDKEFTFIQTMYRFTTTQALVKYNSLGHVIIGSVNRKISVVDYIFFEKLLDYPYRGWKIIDRLGGFAKSLEGFKLENQ